MHRSAFSQNDHGSIPYKELIAWRAILRRSNMYTRLTDASLLKCLHALHFFIVEQDYPQVPAVPVHTQHRHNTEWPLHAGPRPGLISFARRRSFCGKSNVPTRPPNMSYRDGDSLIDTVTDGDAANNNGSTRSSSFGRRAGGPKRR
jgi:hypothetical protein